MLRIYHNPHCRKSRAGLQYLRDKNLPLEVIDYLKKPITIKELEKLIIKLNIKPVELVRTREELYRKRLKGKNFSDYEWIRIIVENPRLLHRPIVENQYRAVIGDPVEAIDVLIK